MAQAIVPVPRKLNIREGNVAENWRKFKSAWNNYEIAAEVDEKPEKVRVAAFLSVIGEEALEVYETFVWTVDSESRKLEKVLEKFEKYCIPRSNVLFETYRFSSRKQNEGESIDSFVTALRRLADGCAFQDKDRRIRDQVVLALRDDRIRERILREPDPNLQKVVEIVRATETAEYQLRKMTEQSTEVNKLQPNKYTQSFKKSNWQNSSKQSQDRVDCKFCGRKHERRKESCPAWNKICNTCGKLNHFAMRCSGRSSTKTNAVETAEVDGLFSVGSKMQLKKMKTITICCTGRKLTFQIDTGASVNVLPLKDYIYATGDKEMRYLKPKKMRLVTYGGKSWYSIGQCTLEVKVSGQQYTLVAVVVDVTAQPLLGLETSEKFGIVKVTDCDQIETFASTVQYDLTNETILSKYKDVFTGLGELEGEYKIKIDETVKPVIHAPRKVPVAIREQLKSTLCKLETDGVIAKVTQPTKWVSSMMIVVKPGKMRICLDPKDLNFAIQREHYPLPTVEEVATRLKNAKVFSLLDAKDGFWQVKLDEESSYLTTFNTPFGRYRWKRMPFGISSAPEVFQRKIHEIAEGLKGVEVIADDFLVCGFGETTEQAAHDHDHNLIALLKKARDKNLKINRDKLRMRLPEVQFMGHVLTKDGIKMDPRKLEAIKNMPTPTDIKSLLRFMGMIQYLSKFLPNLSDTVKQLRKLTVKGVDWIWTNKEEEEFQRVKMKITQAPVLAYYDVTKPVTIQCDASESGIGAALLQDGRPVTYSSRSMTKTEQRYAQIEKEMLAIVHSCTKFEQYIYGRPDIRVETDHKPLQTIFKKPIGSSPKRLQRMLLYLQKFQLDVIYKKGKEMFIADTLSRAYLKTNSGTELEEVMSVVEAKICKDIENVQFVNSIPNSKQRMEEIKKGTEEDTTLQKVIEYVKKGWPSSNKSVLAEVRSYFNIQTELIVEENLLWKGVRVIIPQKLRLSVMKNLHASHLGIEGTLRRAREYVYWPGMNAQVKDYISKCDICNTFRDEQQKEPLVPHDIPTRAWCTVSVDLFEFDNKHFIVVSDHYSNYFEYDRVTPISTAAVIKCLKSIFARYGIPEKLVSDNGTQFSSAEFKTFAKSYGFDHETSSPTYPQSNGKAENAVKTCKRMMKKALRGEGDFFLSLLDFRNTPSPDVGLSPAQRMFGRRLRALIPAKEELLNPEVFPNVREMLERSKINQKRYYDRGSKELEPLTKGDTIRIKLPGQAIWTKGICLRNYGKRSYEVLVNGKIYRRNRKQIIKTNEKSNERDRIDDFCEEENQPVPDTVPVPEEQQFTELRRSTRNRKPVDRYGNWT